MAFAFTEEQDELRSVVRRFLTDRSPEQEVRRIAGTDDGVDVALWTTMARQLGLQGLIVPEAHGGQGFDQVALVLVFEELGRALACTPFFSTVALAANTLLQSGDAAACADLLPGIASGDTVATLAVAGEDGRWERDGIAVHAREGAEGWTLSGASPLVTDGHASSLVLVVARGSRGLGLFAVDGDAPGLERHPLATLDPTRKLARLRFTATPARPIRDGGDAWDVVERVLDLAAVALAAEAVGGAQRCLELAVDYAKVREQFGRAIGSFQAVKHLCADVLVDVESARSGAYYGAWCAAELDDGLRLAASMAKAFCCEAYVRAAAVCIQVHGGIGFTWEHPAHLYYKRAKTSDLLLGDAALHRERLASGLRL